MTSTPDDGSDLAALAGEEPEAQADGTPRCEHCGSALDDVAKMTDLQVLEHMRAEFYRDLYRNLRAGMSTHQEKAIVRGILRDNKIIADDDPEDGDERPVKGRRAAARSETYEFTPRDFSDTEGG